MTSNQLGREKSPYLRQHRDNPVWWYAWGPEAFAAAREQGKPIFLSIGYSTCYWCHVMEKDSFERDDVAEALNKDFISIKVDREERPDVDDLYMQAVVSLTGHGGWPMSVFLTPELHPFWGGTYFPREHFLNILDQIQHIWKSDPKKIGASAEAITAYLRVNDVPRNEDPIGADLLHGAVSELEQAFDAQDGGFGPAPKFPPSAQLGLLLRLHRRGSSGAIAQMLHRTLDAMARGGIYDQIGGGFHRYSTDKNWLVPHFEKMLYDNALLATLYLDTFRHTKDEGWGIIGRETLDYISRDLKSPEGAFYSAEDAGEVGKEGEFYVWSEADLRRILGDEGFVSFARVVQVMPGGNFEHGTIILTLDSNIPLTLKNEGGFTEARRRLLAARSKRERPHRDEKILVSWNALAISALCTGYQAFDDQNYLSAAQRCAKFINDRLFPDGTLLRRYCDGEARFDACQEDYAFLIAALIDLYESDFNENWLSWARELQDIQDARFWDPERGGYYFSDAKELPARRKEYVDGATPSGNSVALHNALRLHALFGDENYRERAQALVAIYAPIARRHPTAVARALQAVDFMLDRSKEIVILKGESAGGWQELVRLVHQSFIPNKVLAAASADAAQRSIVPLLKGRGLVNGQSNAFVCEHGACQLPTSDSAELQKQLQTFVSF